MSSESTSIVYNNGCRFIFIFTMSKHSQSARPNRQVAADRFKSQQFCQLCFQRKPTYPPHHAHFSSILSPVSIQTQSLALHKRKPQETQALVFLAVFVYATHATKAIAFEWKPGLTSSHAPRSSTSCHCHQSDNNSPHSLWVRSCNLQPCHSFQWKPVSHWYRLSTQGTMLTIDQTRWCNTVGYV